jgi:hypothetical protein
MPRFPENPPALPDRHWHGLPGVMSNTNRLPQPLAVSCQTGYSPAYNPHNHSVMAVQANGAYLPLTRWNVDEALMGRQINSIR